MPQRLRAFIHCPCTHMISTHLLTERRRSCMMEGVQSQPRHPGYPQVLFLTTLLTKMAQLPVTLPLLHPDKDSLDLGIVCRRLPRDLLRSHPQPRLPSERCHRTHRSHLVSRGRKDLHYQILHLSRKLLLVIPLLIRMATLPTLLFHSLLVLLRLPRTRLIVLHIHSVRRHTLMININMQILTGKPLHSRHKSTYHQHQVLRHTRHILPQRRHHLMITSMLPSMSQ